MNVRYKILEYYAQISVLKKKLRATDYKALKFAEGELSEYDYAPIRQERRNLRLQINELEEEIKRLKR